MREFLKKNMGLIGLVVFVIALWALFAFYVYDMPKRGTFGDMFGGLNALFSGLAFAGIIYTIYLQRSELALQRQELALTRNELQGQKIQMENQNKTLQLQRFESTFFELLKVHLDIVNASQVGRHNGRECFPQFHRLLRGHYDAGKKAGGLSEREILKQAFKQFHSNYESFTEQYFGNASNILWFIQSTTDEHERYVRFFTSLLSGSEVALLFYYSLSREGEKFKSTCNALKVFEIAKLTKLFISEHASLN